MRDKTADDLVAVFAAPLVLFPSPWADTLPEWIKGEVRTQRLIKVIKGDNGLATDVEALAYIYPRTLEGPMHGDWVEIYCYLTTKVMESRLVGPIQMPAYARTDELSDYQKALLAGLKRRIRETQTRVLTERRRAEKRQHQSDSIQQAEQEQLTFAFPELLT